MGARELSGGTAMVTERRVRPMARIEKGYVLNVRSRIRTESAREGPEPKLIPAIAAHACGYPALVTASTSHVIEFGTSPGQQICRHSGNCW